MSEQQPGPGGPERDWFSAYNGLDREAAEQRAREEDRPVRVLPPGSMMTMDYRPDRLNVETDERGRLVRLWAG